MRECIGPFTFGILLAVLLIAIGFQFNSANAEKSILRECLAHQEWCVEHYQLEEGK